MAETRFDCLPAGNLKPAKEKSTERIDGIVALIMAIGRAMIAQDKPRVLYQMIWVWMERIALGAASRVWLRW